LVLTALTGNQPAITPPLFRQYRLASTAEIGQCLCAFKEISMQINITGHHVDVTPALRAYVIEKMQRINRHFDHVISLNVILSVEKLQHEAEATLHTAGKSLFANASELDMYAAIDDLVDKLDKQVRRFKDKRSDHQVSRDEKQATLG